jgi:acetyl esterase/lipase
MSKLIYWYLGEHRITHDMEYLINTNKHILVLDKDKRKKYESYLDVKIIPEKYKIGKSYYDSYENELNIIEHKDMDIKDENLKKLFSQLFKKDISPALADDGIIKKLPKSYFIILEWDALKDEGLIYAERLKRNNVSVEIAYYENAFHGILPYLGKDFGYQISEEIFNDLTDYIHMNN